MTAKTEPNRLNDVLRWEQDNFFSREKVTVLSGQNLAILAVLGKVTKAQAAAPIPTVSGTGNGTMTNLKPGPDVQTGNYVVKCTSAVVNGGVFSVTAPDSTVLPSLTLTVGAGGTTNYTSTHLDFSITDGSTDFAVDDTFTVAVTAGGTPAVVGTGNGTMSAISLGENAKLGTYRVQCTVAASEQGTFEVIAPDGQLIGLPVTIAAGGGGTGVFVSDHVNFTLTDGSTDFAVGDYFHIVVAAGSGKIKILDPTAVDGTQDAYGILTAAVDASAADKEGVAIVRDAIIVTDSLAWPSTATSAQKATALAQLANTGIVVRTAA